MNPTERYIKMCEKAEEIQREWKPKDWDWVAVPEKYNIWIEGIKIGDYSVLVLSGYETDCYYYGPESDMFDPELDLEEICPSEAEFRKNAIWLPTQEQLEEMLGEHWSKIMQSLYDFYSSIEPEFDLTKKFESLSQVLLAFVMWEKYHKVWDDEKEEWRKIK